MGGVKTIDMRAHGTQKTKTIAMCSNKTKTQAHGQQNKSPAARILISRVFTQDMTTWKHAANEIHELRATPHTTHVDKRARGRANSSRTLTQWDRTLSTSIRTPTQNRNSRHECRDPNTMLQHKTRHADERAHGSSTLEAARSHENRTWRECQGSVTKPWIALDRSDRTLTIPCLLYATIL